MDVLDKILYLVKKNNLSDAEFAKKIGVYPSAITEWKRGKTASYRKYLTKIASVLNTTVDYLSSDEVLSENRAFVNRFKELRIMSELPDRWLVAYLEVSADDIVFWETGVLPPQDILEKLCYFYNVSEDYLLGKTDVNVPVRTLHKYSTTFEQCRRDKGLSRLELSKQMDIPILAVVSFEMDVITEPSIKDYKKYSDFFSVSIDYLMGYSNTKEKTAPAEQSFSKDELEFLHLIETLTEDEKQKVIDYADLLKRGRTQ